MAVIYYKNQTYSNNNNAKVYGGTADPSNSVGYDNDYYYQFNTDSATTVRRTFIKSNGTWHKITSDGIPALATKLITDNGTYVASTDNVDGYNQVNVNVVGLIPSKNLYSVVQNSVVDYSIFGLFPMGTSTIYDLE